MPPIPCLLRSSSTTDTWLGVPGPVAQIQRKTVLTLSPGPTRTNESSVTLHLQFWPPEPLKGGQNPREAGKDRPGRLTSASGNLMDPHGTYRRKSSFKGFLSSQPISRLPPTLDGFMPRGPYLPLTTLRATPGGAKSSLSSAPQALKNSPHPTYRSYQTLSWAWGVLFLRKARFTSAPGPHTQH